MANNYNNKKDKTVKNVNVQSIFGISVALFLGAAVAFAGSQGGASYNRMPVFVICGLLAFGMNWLGYIPSYIAQTEHYYDFMGSVTYITLLLVAVTLTEEMTTRSIILAVCIGVWAVRLGTFLFGRVKKAGFDRRFTKMKTIPLQFLMTWTLQGLWVFITASAGLAAITTSQSVDFGVVGLCGLGLWVIGFGIEIVADHQKTVFRAENKSGFITSGLWAYSRHPNFFGEILLWIGVAVMALPVLVGWQYFTLISPVFVTFLLMFVSGVRMLENSGRKRWGEEPEYQDYIKRTSVLVLLPKRSI